MTTKPGPKLLAGLLSMTAACGACESDSDYRTVFEAKKTVWDLYSSSARLAFVDGATASSDPSVVGEDIMVVAHDGSVLLNTPADKDVRSMALHDNAVATIEWKTSIADASIVIHPLGTSEPISPTLEHIPLAVASNGDGFLWVEVLLADSLDLDGDNTNETGRFDLFLVESDVTGNVAKRTAVSTTEDITAPIALLAPFPLAFGLVVAGDDVYFGWESWLCNGGSAVYRFDKATGTGEASWRGRVASVGPVGATSCQCAEGADNVTDHGHAMAVYDRSLVIVGGVYECASLVAKSGFVVTAGVQTGRADPVSLVAADESLLLIGYKASDSTSGNGSSRLARRNGDGFTDLDVRLPSEMLAGLALADREIFFSTWKGVYAVAR